MASHGDGGGESFAQSVTHGDEDMSTEQMSILADHSSRFRMLQESLQLVRQIGGQAGAGLVETLSRVMHQEKRDLEAMMGESAPAVQRLHSCIRAQEEEYNDKRRELQEQMSMENEKKRAAQELQDLKREVKKLKRGAQVADAAVAAAQACKTFTPEQLGQGKKNSGGVAERKRREEVLDRVRACSKLSAEQTNDWVWFRTAWDKEMATVHGEHWGKLFAEQMQSLVDDISSSTHEHTLSNFMRNETARVLSGHEVLRVPGKPTRGR